MVNNAAIDSMIFRVCSGYSVHLSGDDSKYSDARESFVALCSALTGITYVTIEDVNKEVKRRGFDINDIAKWLGVDWVGEEAQLASNIK